MNKHPRKFRFMFKTQGKNSRVRQNQKLTLSKIGRIWKPALDRSRGVGGGVGGVEI